jgi:hypothetical protein
MASKTCAIHRLNGHNQHPIALSRPLGAPRNDASRVDSGLDPRPSTLDPRLSTLDPRLSTLDYQLSIPQTGTPPHVPQHPPPLQFRPRRDAR